MPKNLFKFLPYFLKIRPMFIYVSTLSLKLNKATIIKLCCRPCRPLTNEDFLKWGKRQLKENASFVKYIYDESVHQLDNKTFSESQCKLLNWLIVDLMTFSNAIHLKEKCCVGDEKIKQEIKKRNNCNFNSWLDSFSFHCFLELKPVRTPITFIKTKYFLVASALVDFWGDFCFCNKSMKVKEWDKTIQR